MESFKRKETQTTPAARGIRRTADNFGRNTAEHLAFYSARATWLDYSQKNINQKINAKAFYGIEGRMELAQKYD